MRVLIENLSKRFGNTAIIRDISLEVNDQELFFLLGPSGCGKTTLLRLVAGFYEADAGRILFGDRFMNGVPPHRRNTGMVFQNYALWPHMSVANNVAYGLEVRGIPSAERKRRVAEALEIVQMSNYAGRMPNQLSGGQQQRIALARALVVQPDVLLLDEPLSNLDAKLRLEMREEIRRIHAQTRITTLYVTHDQKESLSLADRMAVLRGGVIEQIGDPRTVYRAPASRFVADFIGETNWLPAEVQGRAADGLVLRTECGVFATGAGNDLPPGTKVWLGFRPEALRLQSGLTNTFQVQIVHISYLGEAEEYQLRLPSGLNLKAIEQNPQFAMQAGALRMAHVLPAHVFVFPADAA